jgi:hypothetical protein
MKVPGSEILREIRGRYKEVRRRYWEIREI